MPEIHVYPTTWALAQAAADRFIQLGQAALARSRRFRVALAGGSTPRLAYLHIAAQASRLDWSRVHFFWGDERCVPPDHPESNYALARQTLLAHLPVPVENIHRIHGELPAQAAAAAYCQALDEHFGRRPNEPTPLSQPSFDLALLGLGEDGHTASLFPNAPALEEAKRWAVAAPHRVPPPPLVDRVTLTLPAINAAGQVIFLVSGASKAARLAQVVSTSAGGAAASPLLPAMRVQPASGNLIWLVDAEAAQALPE